MVSEGPNRRPHIVTVPSEVADAISRSGRNVTQLFTEAALVELYRLSVLTHHELSQALGVDRFATDAVLNAHAVTSDLPTIDEHNRQVDEIRQMLARP